ncbi:putative fatty-acid--CoA ligase [Nocardia nova SH22a]|uniref:Putative fatty-acid--CoA ligase n=1 Tax=Nocardia nova SH22a TaxID=1415166 RepID=W5TLK6_9NOCA|nr:AMP-binding protein [Nocardia nova]AHH19838.1 putative fatty-acid--CoA ligase [Nocardia nova SH22a]
MPRDVFADMWAATVRTHGDRPFLVFRDETGEVSRWTYREFDTVVGRVADSLGNAGVRPGTSVHVALRNCPAFVALWLAVARLGAWLVPVDPASATRDIARQVARVEPVVGVCAEARGDSYRAGAGGAVRTLIELAEDASDIAPGAALMGTNSSSGVDPVGSDRLAVMFTSGTTSEPKGVVLTQANYAQVADAMARAVDLRPRHRWFVTLPLFHANAQYYCFGPAIAVGASVALTATFSASGWVGQARELEVTHASLFAAPIRMILARCPADSEPLALEHVWFAQNLGGEHYERFARLVGTRPRQLYGLTESIAVVCADTGDMPRADTIGRPLGRRVHIDRLEGGGSAGPGEPGMLSVHGTPGVDLFLEYLDAPEATSAALRHTDDGAWFVTGDVVTTDDDGVMRFVGRADDVIKVAGENVSLTAVEATVAQAPGVLEVAVVARPDPVRDVVPVAYVVARDPDTPPRPEQLAMWAADNLAPSARPQEWVLIDALPRTSVGKVRRFQLPSPPVSAADHPADRDGSTEGVRR